MKSASTRSRQVAAALGLSLLGITSVLAQPDAGRDRAAFVLLPGSMIGPGTVGSIGLRRLCTPRAVGLTQWRTQWVERMIKPTEAQKKALDDLAAASAKAIDIFSAACPKRAQRLQTASAQLDMMERRLDSALQAVNAVRPAFASFYSALDERQRARVDALGPKRQGWLW